VRKKPIPVPVASRLFPGCFAALVLFAALPCRSWAQTHPRFWTGDGGSGIRVTVSEPSGTGLTPREESLLPLVQSTVIGAFQRFSAMTVFDRQNLENILAEQRLALDGHFSDDDFIRIGQLTNARLVVFGSITRIGANYMLELAVTDVETGERRASYPPRPVSLLALEDLSAIREASAVLLGQLGVNLTSDGLQELRRVEDTARIQAENMLARGIAAQRQGTMVEALTYYFQAAAFNPALGEALNRVSVVSADIADGNLGHAVRSRLQEHDEWRTIVNTARSFYTDHLPYELVYDTNARQGPIDFELRTAAFSMDIRLIPTDAWRTINDLRRGLSTARRNDNWTFNLNAPIGPQRIDVEMQVVNDTGAVLSTAAHTFSNPGEADSMNATLTFRDVRIDEITDRLIVRVANVNGVPAQRAGETGFIRISTLVDFDARMAPILAAEEAARIEREERARLELEVRELERRRAARRIAGARGLWEHNSVLLPFSMANGSPVLEGVIFGMPFLSGFYFSPAPFINLGLQSRLGVTFTRDEENQMVYPSLMYLTVAPTFGVTIPLRNEGRIFTNVMLEMGTFGTWTGAILPWLTPGFDIGVEIGPSRPGRVVTDWFSPGAAGTRISTGGMYFSVKYHGMWLQGRWVHGIGVGLGWSQRRMRHMTN